MRVLLSTYGSRGDVEPLVALAVELRVLGVEVVVCAPPDFAERLAGVGVGFVPVGPSASALTVAAPAPSSIPERAARLVAEQFEVVAGAARGCDAMVVTGMTPTAAGALSVAEMVGVPAVSVTFQQLTLPSPHRAPLAYPGRELPVDVTDNRALWDLDAESVEELFGEALNSSRVANGMAPVRGVRDHVIGDRPWLATDPVLDPWREPAYFDVVQTGAWVVPDERPLPDDLVAFLDAGAPPVYVGFGSMPMHGSADVAQDAVEAVRAVGHRVVVLRGWAGLAPVDLRDDCFVVGEVNQRALFGRVAAVVHHGGAGTTTTATRAGAPQVVVPQLADQPYWAGRVADLGVGVAHDGPTPTVGSLTAALAKVLAERTRERAAAVAGTIRTDGAAVAARLLVDRERVTA
ncbi:glycosyltransferase [Umezawaea tangerina]|uniref:Vancomycin aglycone glucosyltransferase n=1 Tax=Umezawaea tangerina TaxID=84725 RepID=A0A2T0SZT6_9PSEU|nr:glycosyltransferase [Umezawaea tangerina]PRY38873.1 vancomycin aglycone glucosyltransferase [Umezawaea tangerina]